MKKWNFIFILVSTILFSMTSCMGRKSYTSSVASSSEAGTESFTKSTDSDDTVVSIISSSKTATTEGTQATSKNITNISSSSSKFPEVSSTKGNEPVEMDGRLLSGLFSGKTTEVVDSTTIGGSLSMHFPDFLWVGDEIWAYYITYATTNGNAGIGLAKSKDGLNLSSISTVIQPDADYDNQLASFPGVWYEDGVFYLVYEAKGNYNTYGYANIALATSTDGVNFQKHGVILWKNKSSSWANVNIGTPDLYKTGDTWYLTFHGYNSQDCQIGVAYGKDLKKLQMNPNPIITTSANPNNADSGTAGRRDIIYNNLY